MPRGAHYLVAILTSALSCPGTAEMRDAVLGVSAPIDELRCRCGRDGTVRIAFVDRNGERVSYLVNLHFMNGDGRVYRILGKGERVRLGARGEEELLGLLSEWSEANIPRAERDRLQATAPEDRTAEDHRFSEILVAIEKLRALPPHRGPVLICKSRECFVHAFASPPPGWGPHVERIVAGGIALARTDRSSGHMQFLGWPTGTVSLNTRVVRYEQTRLIGVSADGERLYTLLWSSGLLRDSPPNARAPLPGGAYKLVVFWLADGNRIFETQLESADLPKTAPPETLGSGPLEVQQGTVSCYGARLRFHGRDRVE